MGVSETGQGRHGGGSLVVSIQQQSACNQQTGDDHDDGNDKHIRYGRVLQRFSPYEIADCDYYRISRWECNTLQGECRASGPYRCSFFRPVLLNVGLVDFQHFEIQFAAGDGDRDLIADHAVHQCLADGRND